MLCRMRSFGPAAVSRPRANEAIRKLVRGAAAEKHGLGHFEGHLKE
jgi:hypothetical protein